MTRACPAAQLSERRSRGSRTPPHRKNAGNRRAIGLYSERDGVHSTPYTAKRTMTSTGNSAMAERFDVVVIGAGPGGFRAARRCAAARRVGRHDREGARRRHLSERGLHPLEDPARLGPPAAARPPRGGDGHRHPLRHAQLAQDPAAARGHPHGHPQRHARHDEGQQDHAHRGLRDRHGARPDHGRSRAARAASWRPAS